MKMLSPIRIHHIAETLSDMKPVPATDSDLGNHRFAIQYEQWRLIVREFAMMLTRNNPRFDPRRFYAACDCPLEGRR